MDLTGAMMDIPGLATAEEREEWEHDPSDDVIPTMPSWWHDLVTRLDAMLPEAMCRKEFEARPPALGLSAADIDELDAHSQNPLLTPVQKRIFFTILRSNLLRQLIPASGAGASLTCVASSGPSWKAARRRRSQSGTCSTPPPWARGKLATTVAPRVGA